MISWLWAWHVCTGGMGGNRMLPSKQVTVTTVSLLYFSHFSHFILQFLHFMYHSLCILHVCHLLSCCEWIWCWINKMSPPFSSEWVCVCTWCNRTCSNVSILMLRISISHWSHIHIIENVAMPVSLIPCWPGDWPHTHRFFRHVARTFCVHFRHSLVKGFGLGLG